MASAKPAVLEPGLELIVGLGNPGSKYAKTRHNAGFWFVDALAACCRAHFRPEQKFLGDMASFHHAGREIRILKPMTFMNRSGGSVAAVMQYYRIPCENILLAHDELDLPVGVIRLKLGGGHGGHNGLRDMAALGSSNYWRLRIGIGHPGHKDQVLDYVLSEPGQADRQLVERAFRHVDDVRELMLAGQMEKAMSTLHTNRHST